MDTMTRVVTAADGRELCVEEAGDLSGRPVFVHGGSPNSRHIYGPLASRAGTDGIHLISYDRPGYGRSTPLPGHNVADCAADVRAIADALGIGRFVSWGGSGGGPYALACAALLADRVPAVASLASPAPFGAPGLDYFAGMGSANADDVRLMIRDPDAARAKLKRDREEILTGGGDQEATETLISPADQAVLSGELGEWLSASMRDGLAQGDQGWWDDSVALGSPWGFDVGAIAIPVQVWHGQQDMFVPFQHGQWLAGHIPTAQPQLSEHDGHLTLLVNRIPEVHRWLLSYL
jgi:pimeloyl-ACP methyl ester carboxylesterase